MNNFKTVRGKVTALVPIKDALTQEVSGYILGSPNPEFKWNNGERDLSLIVNRKHFASMMSNKYNLDESAAAALILMEPAVEVDVEFVKAGSTWTNPVTGATGTNSRDKMEVRDIRLVQFEAELRSEIIAQARAKAGLPATTIAIKEGKDTLVVEPEVDVFGESVANVQG
jgi:hypothetical protein